MNHYLKLSVTCLALLTGSLIYSCEKDKGSLSALPKADFEAVPDAANPNVLILVNKSNTASIPYWHANNATLTGDSAQAGFIFSGTYDVTLYITGKGGIDSITKQVTVAQNDPNACVGTQLGFITSCTQKTWKLDPEAGAYKVGPNGPDDGSWWTSPESEVSARSCEFNDEYTFSFDRAGTFVYDNKGDFYGDGYLGDNSNSCQPSSNYTATQALWGSGSFNYTFVKDAGVNKLGQLTVVGLGAHIGLQKVRNGGEVTSEPATSVTYDVLAETHVDADNSDLLTLGVNLGYGWWTFRLKSSN